MSVIAEAEKLALSLSDKERAELADRLIISLPEDFIDDEELEEALRRDREMDEDPTKVLTHEEFFTYFKERRK
ncbi:MAG: addiction module protein [Pyrinomonadaceae bacterium]